MKQFTPSQLVNVVVTVLMAALVVAVHVAIAHHIPVNPAVVSLAGLAGTAVAGTCRSYVQKFAGLLPADMPGILGVLAPYLSKAVGAAAPTAIAPFAPVTAPVVADPSEAVQELGKTLQQNRAELLAAVAKLSERLDGLPAAAPPPPVVVAVAPPAAAAAPDPPTPPPASVATPPPMPQDQAVGVIQQIAGLFAKKEPPAGTPPPVADAGGAEAPDDEPGEGK